MANPARSLFAFCAAAAVFVLSASRSVDDRELITLELKRLRAGGSDPPTAAAAAPASAGSRVEESGSPCDEPCVRCWVSPFPDDILCDVARLLSGNETAVESLEVTYAPRTNPGATCVLTFYRSGTAKGLYQYVRGSCNGGIRDETVPGFQFAGLKALGVVTETLKSGRERCVYDLDRVEEEPTSVGRAIRGGVRQVTFRVSAFECANPDENGSEFVVGRKEPPEVVYQADGRRYRPTKGVEG